MLVSFAGGNHDSLGFVVVGEFLPKGRLSSLSKGVVGVAPANVAGHDVAMRAAGWSRCFGQRRGIAGWGVAVEVRK